MNTLTLSLGLTAPRVRWLQVPVLVLIALLQRTPLIRCLVSADLLFASGSGALLKSAFVGTVALGTVDTLVGATEMTANPATPASATVGQAFQAAVAITGAPLVPGSYEVQGTVPPGLAVSGMAGDLVNASTLTIAGTPTTAGSYTLNIRAWAAANKQGLGGTPTFSYVINVAGGAASAPAFSTQPQTQTVAVGANVTFTVSVTGSPVPALQWRKDGVDLSGATAATLTLNAVATSAAGSYTVVATNSAGSATSQAAVLTVQAPDPNAPTITLQPLSLTARTGSTVVLTVGATGQPAYQWRKDGVNLSGGSGNVLVLDNVGAGHAGSYTVVVSNGSGSVTSQPAAVGVIDAPDSTIKNLSVRAHLAASRTLIVGFGTIGEKTMLLRGIGPTLATYGVSGAHPNPQLDFYSGQTRLDGNDDWVPALATVFASNGAFALPAGSADAAMVQTVSGPHTAHVRGPQTGVVLVEVYDSGGSGRLINVSALNRVGLGADVLIAGFVLDGAVARSLLIRAVGPKLVDFGVANVLDDPRLEIYRPVSGGESVKVAENNDWDPSLVGLATRAGAAGLPLTPGAKDSTVVITLPPGAYSAVVSGVGNATGEALVEVYELP